MAIQNHKKHKITFPLTVIVAVFYGQISASHAAESRNATQKSSASSELSIPQNIRSLVPHTDVVLAYKALQSPGDGEMIAVAITRKSKSADLGGDANQCELVIFAKRNGALLMDEKSSGIVDCKDNQVVKNSENLNDFLQITNTRITYVDQQIRSNSRFVFRFSKVKGVWYLSKAMNIYGEPDPKTGEMKVVEEIATYPGALEWTPMSSFNLMKITIAVSKHGSKKRS